jgi:hypothetical protein
MLKKIILSVMAVVLLTGSENVFANETNAAAGVEQEKQVLQSGVKRPRQQEFDRYFNALTKAYRENDREKMGQMLRKMNQFRQNQQKAKVVPGKRGQDLPKRRGLGMGWHGRGKGRRGQGMSWHGRGMGRRGQGMCWHGRGKGRRGRGMGWHSRGKGRRGQGMSWHGRGMGGRGRGMGWHGRGMGRRGRVMGWQDRGMSRRGRGMAWQGMGGRGGGMVWQDRSVRRRKMYVPQRDDMPREEFDWDW